MSGEVGSLASTLAHGACEAQEESREDFSGSTFIGTCPTPMSVLALSTTCARWCIAQGVVSGAAIVEKKYTVRTSYSYHPIAKNPVQFPSVAIVGSLAGGSQKACVDLTREIGALLRVPALIASWTKRPIHPEFAP